MTKIRSHNTDAMYQHGCRCEECVNAHRSYRRLCQQRNAPRINAEQRLKRQQDPEKYRLRARLWRRNNPEKCKRHIRTNHLKRLYGLTPEDFDRLVERQGNCCGICGESFQNLPPRQRHIDHDHQTNIVRGLLCFACNRNLGIHEYWYLPQVTQISQYLAGSRS